MKHIDQVNSVIRGQARSYLIKKVLGNGAISQVLLGSVIDSNNQSDLSQDVAIKVLKTRTFVNDEENKYFFQEHKIVQKLCNQKDENIVNIFEVIPGDSEFYVVMEYCQNGSLLDHISLRQQNRLKVVINFSIQLAKGIYFLHSIGVVHRDLKPENVFIYQIGSEKVLKIGDYGLGKSEEISMMHSCIGTINYMAPEMIRKQSYDPSIDTWALGCIMHELLTGAQLFYDSQISGISKQIKTLKHYRCIEGKFGDLIAQCLQPNPSDRISIPLLYQSLTKLFDDLSQNKVAPDRVVYKNNTAQIQALLNNSSIQRYPSIKKFNQIMCTEDNQVQQNQMISSTPAYSQLNSFLNKIQPLQINTSHLSQEKNVYPQLDGQLQADQNSQWRFCQDTQEELNANVKIKKAHKIKKTKNLLARLNLKKTTSLVYSEVPANDEPQPIILNPTSEISSESSLYKCAHHDNHSTETSSSLIYTTQYQPNTTTDYFNTIKSMNNTVESSNSNFNQYSIVTSRESDIVGSSIGENRLFFKAQHATQQMITIPEQQSIIHTSYSNILQAHNEQQQPVQVNYCKNIIPVQEEYSSQRENMEPNSAAIDSLQEFSCRRPTLSWNLGRSITTTMQNMNDHISFPFETVVVGDGFNDLIECETLSPINNPFSNYLWKL